MGSTVATADGGSDPRSDYVSIDRNTVQYVVPERIDDVTE